MSERDDEFFVIRKRGGSINQLSKDIFFYFITISIGRYSVLALCHNVPN